MTETELTLSFSAPVRDSGAALTLREKRRVFSPVFSSHFFSARARRLSLA
jgi:hypothetical protein